MWSQVQIQCVSFFGEFENECCRLMLKKCSMSRRFVIVLPSGVDIDVEVIRRTDGDMAQSQFKMSYHSEGFWGLALWSVK